MSRPVQVTVLDVDRALRDASAKCLRDASVDRRTRRKRALALRALGRAFLNAVKHTTHDESWKDQIDKLFVVAPTHSRGDSEPDDDATASSRAAEDPRREQADDASDDWGTNAPEPTVVVPPPPPPEVVAPAPGPTSDGDLSFVELTIDDLAPGPGGDDRDLEYM